MDIAWAEADFRIANRCDIDLARVFCAIYRHRNLTTAGNAVLLTQPSMSRALSRLRHAFRDPLFQRNGTTMEPTTKARLIAPNMFQILKNWSIALSESDDFNAAHSSALFTVGMNDLLSAIFLPHLIECVRKCAPGVTLRVMTVTHGDLPEAIESGEVDLAVISQFPDAVGLSAQFLFRQDHVVLMPAALACPEPRLSLDLYCALPHALVSYSGSERGWADQALAALGRTRKVALTLQQFLPVPLAVAHSSVISTLPRRFAEWSARHFDLTTRELPFASLTHDFHSVWLPRDNRSSAYAWLRDRTLEAARALSRPP